MTGKPQMDVKLVQAATSNRLRNDILKKLMQSDLDFAVLQQQFKLNDQMLKYHLSLLERALLIKIEEKVEGAKTVSLSPLGKTFMEGKTTPKKDEDVKQQAVKRIEVASIAQLLPCIADPNKLRVIAEFKPSLDSALKSLKSAFKGARYSDHLNVLVFQRGVKLFTIYPSGKITMTMIESEAEGIKLVEEIKSRINEALEKGIAEPEAKVEPRIVVSPLDVLKYLPKSDCKQCGEQSCYAFAIKLLSEGVKLSACKPLLEEKFSIHMEHLAALVEFT